MVKKSSPRPGADDSASGTPANGLVTVSLHGCDDTCQTAWRRLQQEREKSPQFAWVGLPGPSAVDPETMATRYLQHALGSKAVPELFAPEVDGIVSEFRCIGTEAVPLTHSTNVRFRQMIQRVPVYGSLAVVELDNQRELLGISATVGRPRGVSPLATLAPADAVAIVRDYNQAKTNVEQIPPRLYFYFDPQGNQWRLVYLLEDVPVSPRDNQPQPPGPSKPERPLKSPLRMDFVVDAHQGEIVAQLPRTPTMVAVLQSALDGLGRERQFQVEQATAKRVVLNNSLLNVQTYDFRFQDPETDEDALPGTLIPQPPAFSPSAVSAHANAEEVSRFMRDVLLRNNIDNQGGVMISSINCVVQRYSEDGKEWINAFWNGKQMVYGQRRVNKQYRSMAVALDIVGHEMFHGVTDHTARLEYARESGALNESYSDIFGVILANAQEPDPRRWNWEIGAGLDPGNQPFRDMSDPPRWEQPDHMRDYQKLPDTEGGDYGGVHVNSGIHNKAAFYVLTATDEQAELVFRPRDVAALFYLTLTQQLSRTSRFADSLRGMVNSARTYWRALAADDRNRKIKSIQAAYGRVGIR